MTMSKRGPKPQTAKNKPPRATGRIVHISVEPTSALNEVALTEFWRLVRVLDSRGSLDRVDLATVTECARVKETLDIMYALNDLKQIPLFTSQRRGLLRELGLTIKPSTTLVKTIAKNSTKNEDQSAVSSYLKLKA